MFPGEQHVVGLHVAVHDAVGVCVGERVAHVAQDAHRVAHGQLTLVDDAGAQRLARDVRHDVVEQVTLRTGGEQRDDMGMLQRGGQPDLTLEPLGAHARRQLGREHLHHHLPAEPYFLGEEDAAHAAAAELALDTVRVT